MRRDRADKVIQMIPTRKITNASVSAGTYGSGGNGTKGIVDTAGYDLVRVEVSHGVGNTKLTKFHLGFLSAPNFAIASATLFSGLTSGIVLSNKTASQSVYGFDLYLPGITHKRYMTCKLTNSTTSCPFSVTARLRMANEFPPATTGFTSLTQYGTPSS